MKKILNRNEKTENCDIRLKSENDRLLEKSMRASEAFNEYFTVGLKLANQLPRPSHHLTAILIGTAYSQAQDLIFMRFKLTIYCRYRQSGCEKSQRF